MLTIALVLAYVVGFATILFMIHYIAVRNCREMADNGRVASDRILYIGGKLFVYFLVAAGIAWGVLYLDYILANKWEVYLHSTVAAACTRSMLLFFALFLLFLVINTVRIHRNTVTGDGFLRYFQTRLFRNIILSCLVMMLTIYVLQLQKWTGKDNANFEAKQYWVPGQVLNGFRLVLTTFIHPEIPIMIPANLLQQWIYNRGTQYLPENDGEIGVWQNSWFHYHYSRRGRKLLFIRKGKPSDLMLKILDRQWFCLKTMATKPFADHQMEEEHYYRDYPALALSYNLREGWYSGKLVASAARLAQMEKHVLRSSHLSQWLWELGEKWQASEKTLRFLKKHPKLEALRLAVLLFELEDVIQGEIYSRSFSCNSQSVQRYINLRKEFVQGSSGYPAYRRMKSMVQGQRLYEMVVQNGNAPSIKYVLKHYCGYEVAGKENYSYWEPFAKARSMSPKERAEMSAKNNFDDEIKILEEMYNE